MARPTDFKPEFCEEARKLCENGATDVEVADALDICAATLYRWKNKFPEFCEALKSGKASADERVERSLYHKAIGYSFDAEKIHVLRDGEVVRVPYREHIPPDTTAGIFWLKNRRPDQWRDKRDIDVKHDVSEAFLNIWTTLSEQAARPLADSVAEQPERPPQVRH